MPAQQKPSPNTSKKQSGDLMSMIREAGDAAMLRVAQSKDLTLNSSAGGKEEDTSPRLRTVEKLRTTAAESLVAEGRAKDLNRALELVDKEF